MNASTTTALPTYASEWEINSHGTSAAHKSGLTVQLHNRGFALNVHGIEGLAGTPWARKTGDLVEQGISLLGAATARKAG